MASATTSNTRSSPHPTTEVLARELYTAHRARLHRIARRNSHLPEDAEDALQDAFLLFIDHFDPSEGSPPLAWLILTLKRRCWALNRRRQTRTDHELPHTGIDYYFPNGDRQPHQRTEAAETLTDLRRQLAQLKPNERQALGLSILGYTYREIADLHGWTYTKVCRCIREGRAALRKAQEKEPP